MRQGPLEAGHRAAPRRGALLLAAAAIVAAGGGAAWALTSRTTTTSDAPPAPEARLADAEIAVLASGAAGAASAADAAHVELPANAERPLRRRAELLAARRLLAEGRAADAASRLDDARTADPAIADPAWSSVRLRAASADRGPELALVLARGWRDQVPEESPDRPWIDAEVALLLAEMGRFDEATILAEPWSGRPLEPMAAARLALAEALVDSGSGRHAAGAAALARAVEHDRRCDPRERLGDDLWLAAARDMQEAALAAGAFAAASTLGERAVLLAGDGPWAAEALRRQAIATRGEAEGIRAALRTGAAAGEGAVSRMNRRLMDSAEASERHASRMSVDAGVDSAARRGESLINAAECWAMAGWGERAVAAWREWLAARPDSDPRRAEVLWRIAETHHGDGRFAEAVGAYEQLLHNHPNSPLAARCPAAMGRVLRVLGRDADAGVVLDRVVSGQAGISPESPAYVEALVESGRLHHAAGRWDAAAERLEEALRRRPDLDRAQELRTLLGDCRRSQAISLQARLEGASPASERRRLEAEAVRRWTQSVEAFAAVVAWLDARDLPADDALMRTVSQSARLGLAGSLAAIGRRREAAAALEEVDRRHPGSQASLVALVQLIAAAESQEAAEALRRRAASRLSAAERNSPAEGAEAPLLPLLAWSEWLGVPGPAPLAARLEGSP